MLSCENIKVEISGYFLLSRDTWYGFMLSGTVRPRRLWAIDGWKTKCDGLGNKAGSSLISELGGQKGSLKSQLRAEEAEQEQGSDVGRGSGLQRRKAAPVSTKVPEPVREREAERLGRRVASIPGELPEKANFILPAAHKH